MANKKISQLSVRTPSVTDLMLIGDPSTGFSYKATISAVSSVIESAIGGNYVTLATTQTISGAKTFSNTLTLSSVSNASTDTDKFVVLDGGVVKYRTGTQLLSDIGGVASSSISGTSGKIAKFTGTNSLGNSLITESGEVISINYSGQDDAFYVNASTYYVYLGDANSFANGTNIVIDDATGIVYSNAYSYQRFDIGGAEKMRLTSTGLGIGTTSPAYKLDVSISSGTEAIRWTNSTRSGYTYVDANGVGIFSGSGAGGQGFYLNDASINLSLWTNGSAKMTITSGGNVGIGTSSPAYKLDVSGTGRFTSSVGIGTAPSQLLTLGGSADVQMSLISSTTTGSDEIYFGDSDGTYRGLLRYANDGDYMSFHTSASERMRITSSGNVGIGTTSPNYTASGRTVLDLNGSSSSLFAMSIGGSAVAYLFHDNTDLKLLNANAGALTFSTSATERMRITSGGDVGIGTTSPIYPLFVYKAGTFAFGSVYTISAFNDNTGAYKGINLGYDSGSQTGVIYAETASAASNMAFWTYNGSAWGERMRITSGGDVGIGTSSPTTYSGYTTLALNNATNGGLIDFMAAGNVLAQIYATTSYLSVGSFTNMPVRFMTNNSERMRITSGGNVGIGTTSPSQKLTIGDGSGTGNQYIRMYSSASDIYLGQTSSNLFGAGNGQVLVADATYTSNFAIGTISPNESVNLIFGTNNLERMRIKANGIINLSNVPTSSAGLSSGDVYKTVAGVLMIV